MKNNNKLNNIIFEVHTRQSIVLFGAEPIFKFLQIKVLQQECCLLETSGGKCFKCSNKITGCLCTRCFSYEYSTFASISCWFTGKILFSSNISHHSEEFLNKNLSDEVLKEKLQLKIKLRLVNLIGLELNFSC